MITAASHASAHGGGTATFAVGTGTGGLGLRVENFAWTPRIASGPPPKLQSVGMWPGNTDPRELVIDVDGLLVGSSPSDYWSRREAILEAILKPPDYDRTIRHDGTLSWTSAAGKTYTALVNLAEHAFPLTSQQGRSSPYRISWVAYAGYWTESGNLVSI